MSPDRSFVEANRASTDRIRRLASAVDDKQMQQRVGEHWTVAMVFAHLAFWDWRVLNVLEVTEREGKLTVPAIDVIVNDILLPQWAAIPPREAARMAVEAAEALDARLENLPQALLDQVHNHNQRWVFRALHRGGHLEEVDVALGKG